MTATPRLRVRLDAAGDELTVAAGEVVRLGDRDALVPALTGRSGQGLALLEVDGRRIRGRSLARRVRAGLAVVAGTEVAPDVSVRDHLIAVAAAADADRVLAGAPLLAARGGTPAGVLSGGERRVLAWLTAVLVHPRVVLLDGAGAGLDDDALAWAHTTVDRWLDRGVAVLVRVGRVEEAPWVTHRADGAPR